MTAAPSADRARGRLRDVRWASLAEAARAGAAARLSAPTSAAVPSRARRAAGFAAAALLLAAPLAAQQGTFAPLDGSSPLAGIYQAPVDTVTLAEALERAAAVDPLYIQAIGRQDQAGWTRRAARLAFLVPALNAQLDATYFSRPFFNIGIGAPSSVAVNARVNASYEIFSLRKFADLESSSAGLEAAKAGTLGQRFLTALATERDFYQVTTDRELLRVAEERTTRAKQQLEVARARVLSGAAVQTDSLTLLTELVQAEIAEARQRLALGISRAQLGRRIGADAPVEAAAPTVDVAAALPIGFGDAVAEALRLGPTYRQARATERQARAQIKAAKSTYFPTFAVNAANQTFDVKFFPTSQNTSQVQFVVQFPIWNLGQRETQVIAARVQAQAASAVRADLERAAYRDVLEAYGGVETQRQIIALADRAVAAARENYRVQDLRYRAGATTILDLIEAQFRLAQAEADAVQARFGARLALAGLEAILGRRLLQP